MPNYQNAKIYKLVSPNGLVYIGSTCQYLSCRKAGHKANYFNYLIGKGKYISSVSLFEEDSENIAIVLIEKFPCNDSEELHKRERYYIDSMECVNKNIPARKQIEYRKKYKDKTAKYNKNYYCTNREEIIKKYSLDKHHDCVCGGKYKNWHKSRHALSKIHQAYMKSLHKNNADNEVVEIAQLEAELALL